MDCMARNLVEELTLRHADLLTLIAQKERRVHELKEGETRRLPYDCRSESWLTFRARAARSLSGAAEEALDSARHTATTSLAGDSDSSGIHVCTLRQPPLDVSPTDKHVRLRL